MMVVKVVKGGRATYLPCLFPRKAENDDGSGITVELVGAGPGVPPVVSMPADADKVFLMTGDGETFETLYWPPRAARSTSPSSAPTDRHAQRRTG